MSCAHVGSSHHPQQLQLVLSRLQLASLTSPLQISSAWLQATRFNWYEGVFVRPGSRSNLRTIAVSAKHAGLRCWTKKHADGSKTPVPRETATTNSERYEFMVYMKISPRITSNGGIEALATASCKEAAESEGLTARSTRHSCPANMKGDETVAFYRADDVQCSFRIWPASQEDPWQHTSYTGISASWAKPHVTWLNAAPKEDNSLQSRCFHRCLLECGSKTFLPFHTEFCICTTENCMSQQTLDKCVWKRVL